jgi:hypothetical protein
MLDICAHIKAFIFIKLACNVLTTMLRCDFIFSSSPPRRIKPINIQGGVPFLIHKESAHPRRRHVFLRRRHVFLRRSCMFLRRRGAPFGPPHRVSHKCYAFPRRSCGVSTEMLRVSTVKMLYNQGFPFLYNTFYQGGQHFARGGGWPTPLDLCRTFYPRSNRRTHSIIPETSKTKKPNFRHM